MKKVVNVKQRSIDGTGCWHPGSGEKSDVKKEEKQAACVRSSGPAAGKPVEIIIKTSRMCSVLSLKFRGPGREKNFHFLNQRPIRRVVKSDTHTHGDRIIKIRGRAYRPSEYHAA